MSRYEEVLQALKTRPRRWLVTGAAGFIGSHLVEKLLMLGQDVTALDNLSTGYVRNIDIVSHAVGEGVARLRFIEGDICDLATCQDATSGVDLVLHQAALGSVPRSIEDPMASHQSNINGFLNMLIAARDAGVSRMVYAASSSTYGDSEELPKVEARIGNPLSPYAVTKLVNEIYADVFHRTYGLDTVGLRYFNVFGPRQDPEGAYAAVIPRWASAIREGRTVEIYGDGETSRDFTYVDNVVQCNLLAALMSTPEVAGQVYNVACGESTTLNQLFNELADIFRHAGINDIHEPVYKDFRRGDVRYSLASIEKARRQLGYQPEFNLRDGLERTFV